MIRPQVRGMFESQSKVRCAKRRLAMLELEQSMLNTPGPLVTAEPELLTVDHTLIAAVTL